MITSIQKSLSLLVLCVLPLEVISQSNLIFTELSSSCNIYMNASVLNRSSTYGEEQVVNGNYQGVAQQYNGLTGQLKSVFFRGRVNPAALNSSNTVKVVVYNANLGYPGTIIGSVNVVINAAPSSYDVLATFSSPLNVNGDVIISIEPFSPATDNFFIQRNTPPEGQFLNLTKIKQANQWFKNLAAGDPAFDFDFIIIPVTTTNLNAAFTSNTALNITNFVNNSTNGVNFEWDFGDGTTSTQVSPSHSYAVSGTYNVTLIAFGSGITNCADTIVSPVNVVITSQQELNNETNGLLIENSLVTDFLTIEATEKMKITIVDALGKNIASILLEKNRRQMFDTRSLTPGIYYIQAPYQQKMKFAKVNN